MFNAIKMCEDNYPDLEILNEEDFYNLKYVFGRVVEEYSTLKFRCKNIEELFDFFLYANIICVSEKIKKFISTASGFDVQFLPIDIICNNGVVSYYIFNVLTKYDCVDFDKSDVYVQYGEIFSIKKLVINYENVEEAPCFLVDKSAVQLICLNDILTEALKKSKVTGVDFVPLEDFTC